EAGRKLPFAEFVHGAPNALARVSCEVRIVQQQQVEPVSPASGQRLFGGHAQVFGELIRRTKLRVREARIAFRAVAFAGIKIVSDRADEAVGIAWQAGERASEHFIGGAVAVNVRGHERADALPVGVLNDLEKAFFAERLTEVHVASAAPGSKSSAGNVHKISSQ